MSESAMKRYWVFQNSTYYPQGGFDDFSEDFTTFGQAKDFIKNNKRDENYILDTKYKNYVRIF